VKNPSRETRLYTIGFVPAKSVFAYSVLKEQIGSAKKCASLEGSALRFRARNLLGIGLGERGNGKVFLYLGKGRCAFAREERQRAS